MNDTCTINCKRAALAGLAAFLVFNVLEFLVHGVLLMGRYADPRYQTLWNQMDVMAGRRWLSLVGYAVYAFAFARLYAGGHEPAKPALAQGLKFGVMAGLLVSPAHAFTSYMVYPVQLSLAMLWAVTGVLESVVLGAVVSLVYKPDTTA